MKSKIKISTKVIKAILPLLLIILIYGCSTIKGIGESIVGTYMGGLEKARANGKAEVFDYTIGDCFDKILIILDDIDAKVIKMDIHNYKILAVIYRAVEIEDVDSDVNTADVGFFLTQGERGGTKVEISCFSSVFLKYVSDTMFSKLKKGQY